MARLASGGLVTMNACGRAIPSCASDIRVFCERAILRPGIWGERLEIQRAGDAEAGARRVRGGRARSGSSSWPCAPAAMPNPSPPEVGLRMARLWDAIRTSSARGGAVVRAGALHAGSVPA